MKDISKKYHFTLPSESSISNKKGILYGKPSSVFRNELGDWFTTQLAFHRKDRWFRVKSCVGFEPPIPYEIQYEEDKIREWFYQDHPWELHQPISLTQLEDSLQEGIECNPFYNHDYDVCFEFYVVTVGLILIRTPGPSRPRKRRSNIQLLLDQDI